ncbi:MAG: hypothetical protein IGS49_05680 [Chlorogloeopsis fritschii C42_A2020_084]|uniref:hypothetical protein n=1 Tax=Chlorogloeopsis fritschii TaxID=1124 RepID=UPI0019EC6ED9|nr:hypothetical protein [Chlorogloeopsis fritschii]MBF2004953.1 hypothetical protein [Chlorogloeopsis fritschii C42_A2020_084]
MEQNQDDADVHQDLRISLYYLNNRLYRKEAVTHLEQAERLFEFRQDSDRAAVARVIKTLVSYNC